jgi:hypothetical protein
MNTIIINGTKIQTNGKNISVIGNSIYVDNDLVIGDLKGTVNVRFEGDLASLKCNGSATINGNIKGNVDVGGSLTCNDIVGNVDTGGSLKCGNISGDVDAGGSVSMRK